VPKIVGIRERTDKPILKCFGCGAVIALVSSIVYKCAHCEKTFCKECFGKHDAFICEIVNR
jgi:hypothetical protein